MSQDNNFHQYGYDHYLKAPAKFRASVSGSNRKSSYIFDKLRSPAVATVALLAAGSLFAAVIFFSYPSSNDSERQIPIIKADLRPIKTQPLERGGMSIPNRDSEILANVGQPEIVRSISREESSRIENLLALSSDDLITKEQAIERAMELDKVPVEFSANVENLDDVKANSNEGSADFDNEIDPASVNNNSKPLVEPSSDKILQKIDGSEAKLSEDNSKFSVAVAMAALVPKPAYTKKLEKSPDTIDYVRRVLTDGSAPSPSEIEPAAGAASSAAKISGGSYFVQLASITDSKRAAQEWLKMQSRYYVLSSAQYRVQEASLASGRFYRIQAGPMSKASANEICSALKAAGKPGGCLVVK